MPKKILNQGDDLVSKLRGAAEEKIASMLSRFRSKKLTVQAEVKGSEKVEEVKRKLESLPNAKTVKMKVEKSGDYPEFQVSSHKSQVLRALNGRCWQ